MNNRLQQLRSRFKSAKSLNQIIKAMQKLVNLVKTEPHHPDKELNTVFNTAQMNDYHPEKEFKMPKDEDVYEPTSKYWKEWERIQKFPSQRLTTLNRHGEYLDKENSTMADGDAYRHCKNNNLRVWVNKTAQTYTKHYNDAWSKAFEEHSKNNWNAADLRLFDQEKELSRLERELLAAHKLNKLREKYEWYFDHLLKYGEACLKRNGITSHKRQRPRIIFWPTDIELSKQISIDRGTGDEVIISTLTP
jgi:hypothetical protein